MQDTECNTKERTATDTGAIADAPNVRRACLRAIAATQTTHENGAPLGEIVEAVADEFRLSVALDALADLHTQGEIYQPRDDRLKLTSAPNDPTLFDDDWEPEPCSLREGQARDDDNTHTNINDDQVEMLTDGDGGEDA